MGGDDLETREPRMAEGGGGVLQDRRNRSMIMKLGLRWATLAKETGQEQQGARRASP